MIRKQNSQKYNRLSAVSIGNIIVLTTKDTLRGLEFKNKEIEIFIKKIFCAYYYFKIIKNPIWSPRIVHKISLLLHLLNIFLYNIFNCCFFNAVSL